MYSDDTESNKDVSIMYSDHIESNKDMNSLYSDHTESNEDRVQTIHIFVGLCVV